MIKLVVFDFDGTLADTKNLVFDVVKSVLKEANYNINHDMLETHLGMMPLEGTLLGFGVHKDSIQDLASKIWKVAEKKIRDVKPVSNLSPLKELKQKKIVLSNSIGSVIKDVFDSWKTNYFDEIHGSDEFEDKEERFNVILAKYKLKASEVVYIGDKTIDVELARKVGCVSVAMHTPAAWDSLDKIKSAKPDYIIKNWRELLRVIKELDS